MERIVIDYLAEELKKAEPVVDYLAEELEPLPGFDKYGLKAMAAKAGR